MRLGEEGSLLCVMHVQARVHCEVFKDNSGALEMTKVHKFRPQMKHLNVKLYHFWLYVESSNITKYAIHNMQQIADYLTKPLKSDMLQ